jgi:hypothetical protein
LPVPPRLRLQHRLPNRRGPDWACAGPQHLPPWRLGAIVGLAVAAPIFGPGLLFPRTPPTLAVMPIAGAGHENEVAAMAAGVTERLIDGLARIDNIRVVAPQPAAAAASARPVSATSAPAEFVVTGELKKDEHAWTLQARLIRTASN